MKYLSIFLIVILNTSCNSLILNNIDRITIEDVNNCTKKNNCVYMCTNYEIVRIRHLSNETRNDSLFVSFDAFKNEFPDLDSSFILYTCVDAFNNCVLVFNKYKIFNYKENKVLKNKNSFFKNGIEYQIWLNDSINSSYFFKFEEMDNNLRKMDFELLPNMISKKKSGI